MHFLFQTIIFIISARLQFLVALVRLIHKLPSVTTTVSSTSSSSSSSSSVTILGGTSTIGKSIISLFCDKNYKVYASYRSKHKAQSLLQALSAAKIKNKPSLFEYHFNEMNYNYSNITTIHDYDNSHSGDNDSLTNDLIPPGFGACSPYKHNILINSVGVCLYGTSLAVMIESMNVNYLQPKILVDRLIDTYLHDDRYDCNQLTVINISSGDGERCYLHSTIAQALDNINDLQSLDDYVAKLFHNHDTNSKSCIEYAYGDTPMYSLSKAILNKYTELKHLQVMDFITSSSSSSSSSLASSSSSSSTTLTSPSSTTRTMYLSSTSRLVHSDRIRIFSYCPGNIDSPMSTAEELLSAVPVEEAVRYLYEIAIDTCDSNDGLSDVDSISSSNIHKVDGINEVVNNFDDRICKGGNKYQSGLFYRHNQLLNW